MDFPAAHGRSAVKGWLAVLAVTLGIFSLMTSELLPVGLLTPIGTALDVSGGTAGLMVTVPGLVAAVSAPLVTVATGRIDRRIVLVVLIGLMGAANLASAFATSFTVVLVARFLIGVSVGGFWSVAGGIALRLVPARHAGRATAVIFGGVETASVLGAPTGTFIGDLSGWRTAFAAVGVLGLVSLVCMFFLMPKVPAGRALTFSELPDVFRSNAGVRIGIALTFLVITGHFLAYTFVRPILQGDGVGDSSISVLLLTFGAAGICGNFIAGALVARRLRRCVGGIAVVLATAMASSPSSTPTPSPRAPSWSCGAWVTARCRSPSRPGSSMPRRTPPRRPPRCTSPRSTCPSRSERSSAGSPSTAPAPRACCGSGPPWPSWHCSWRVAQASGPGRRSDRKSACRGRPRRAMVTRMNVTGLSTTATARATSSPVAAV